MAANVGTRTEAACNPGQRPRMVLSRASCFAVSDSGRRVSQFATSRAVGGG